MEDLESGNLAVQEEALERLPTWQTRWVIPQLELSAASSKYGIYEAAFDALVRADTLEAEVILRTVPRRKDR